MKARRLIVALMLALVLLALAAAAALARTSVTLYSPNGAIERGQSIYYYGEVRLHSRNLPNGVAACEEHLTGDLLNNRAPRDQVALTSAFSDEYCEGQLRLASLPRIVYRSNGAITAKGKFVVELGELGCVYRLKHPSARFYGEHLQATLVGHARLAHRLFAGALCPTGVTGEFDIFAAYDSPAMLPSQMDYRSPLA